MLISCPLALVAGLNDLMNTVSPPESNVNVLNPIMLPPVVVDIPVNWELISSIIKTLLVTDSL